MSLHYSRLLKTALIELYYNLCGFIVFSNIISKKAIFVDMHLSVIVPVKYVASNLDAQIEALLGY